MLGSLSSFQRFIDSRFQFNVLLQNVGQRTDGRHRTLEGGREGGREEQSPGANIKCERGQDRAEVMMLLCMSWPEHCNGLQVKGNLVSLWSHYGTHCNMCVFSLRINDI